MSPDPDPQSDQQPASGSDSAPEAAPEQPQSLADTDADLQSFLGSEEPPPVRWHETDGSRWHETRPQDRLDPSDESSREGDD
jgi:hypothetical protein